MIPNQRHVVGNTSKMKLYDISQQMGLVHFLCCVYYSSFFHYQFCGFFGSFSYTFYVLQNTLWIGSHNQDISSMDDGNDVSNVSVLKWNTRYVQTEQTCRGKVSLQCRFPC
mmetsp:Transcript_17570/g.23073  ORF Transcript_17570/g.23073 Transcript_17570/m.23073 type:complete len:111 (+) Transcript_17570:89-421(+)